MPAKTLDKKIPRFKRGARSLKEAHLNSIVDGVNKSLIGVNAPVQATPRGKAGGSAVIILYYVSMQDDYIVCEDSSAATVYVAKAYELRTTPFDGETIGGVTYTYTSAVEREASDGGSPAVEETQFVTPNYVVGAEIYATKARDGTGVQTIASPPEDVLYIEINQGRAWAVEAP